MFLSALCSESKSAAAGLTCLTYVWGVFSSFSFSDSLLLLYLNVIGEFNVSEERELKSFFAPEDDFWLFLLFGVFEDFLYLRDRSLVSLLSFSWLKLFTSASWLRSNVKYSFSRGFFSYRVILGEKVQYSEFYS